MRHEIHPPHCRNCKGPHTVWDRACPYRQREFLVAELRAGNLRTRHSALKEATVLMNKGITTRKGLLTKPYPSRLRLPPSSTQPNKYTHTITPPFHLPLATPTTTQGKAHVKLHQQSKPHTPTSSTQSSSHAPTHSYHTGPPTHLPLPKPQLPLRKHYNGPLHLANLPIPSYQHFTTTNISPNPSTNIPSPQRPTITPSPQQSTNTHSPQHSSNTLSPRRSTSSQVLTKPPISSKTDKKEVQSSSINKSYVEALTNISPILYNCTSNPCQCKKQVQHAIYKAMEFHTSQIHAVINDNANTLFDTVAEAEHTHKKEILDSLAQYRQENLKLKTDISNLRADIEHLKSITEQHLPNKPLHKPPFLHYPAPYPPPHLFLPPQFFHERHFYPTLPADAANKDS